MSGSNVEETSEQTRGGRSSLLHGAGAEVRRIHLVMLLPTWRQGSRSKTFARGAGLASSAVSHEEFMSFQDKVMTMFASVESRMEALAARMDARDQEIRQELAIYKTAVSARVMATHEAPRVEVPKLHTFSGKRDAKELDNFLWHMERYFEAIALTDEATKVRTATLYLTDNATLWGVDGKNLKRLKHTGSIREYVKEFSTLMLEIPNMAEEELLSISWTTCKAGPEQELRRRGVQDLATAMAVAESLVDYRKGDSSKPKATIQGPPRPWWTQVPLTTLSRKMRQEGWSSKHPRKEDGSRQSIQRQAITWSSSRGDYAHRLMGRKGRLHSAPMDDFKMVLGMDFLQKVKAVPLPFLRSMAILEEEKPCMVPTVTEGTPKTPMLSAMQVKKGLKREEVTYLATLKEEKDDGREEDHKIKLELGAKPRAMGPYRMAPPELEELGDNLRVARRGVHPTIQGSLWRAGLVSKETRWIPTDVYRLPALNKVTVKNKYPIPLIADLFDQLGKGKVLHEAGLKVRLLPSQDRGGR
ncbi:hypothetical protein CK203_025243 [Vitis vinifera]|uniref:Retrotransposon gag domain-containing protein n=1 Tax=Vitis vinifera TaxID=29760 RepID=A0A438JFA5_VITVI|nr:hypothetical protein CK203_025243 [Vitis vinifera]